MYFLGQTTSALIEGNDSAKTDLFIGKVSEHGKVNWLRHYGKETQDQLGADLSESESAGAILLSPKHELIVTFQTQGSVFDTYQGNTDIGVMKVDASNGAIVAGQQIGGPGQEGLNQGTFVLDGDRIVIPLRTQSNLADIVGKAKVSDAGYVVLEDDLSVSAIVQLGRNSYSEWATANNFTGSVVADDQFRSAVVNGPGDYLFFGKTSNNLSDTVQTNDNFFARYVDNKLVSLIQYGANRFPEGTDAEEPRYMVKDENGRIYCVGHSRSSLFEAAQGTINPLVFRVDVDGKLINGVQLGSVTSHQQGVGNNYYTLIQQANFIVRDGKIILGANNANSSSGPTESMIWQVDAF